MSSTVGHNLMHDHPFAEQRFQQANDNLSKLIPVLKEGDISAFIQIVESEALSLHAMMMTVDALFYFNETQYTWKSLTVFGISEKKREAPFVLP